MSTNIQLVNQERSKWGYRIKKAWQTTLEGIFETGRLLVQAKCELPHGEFQKMIERDLPFGSSTARRLMPISRDQRLLKRAHGHVLPSSWRTLYELTKLDDQTFELAFAQGIVRPDMEREQLRSLRRQIRQRNEEKSKALIKPVAAIHHCAIENAGPDLVPDSSIDAIITDPPYPAESLPVFSALSLFADRVLKPGGWCVVMTGAIFLPEVIERLGEYLTYRWQYVVTTPGGPNSRISSIGIFQGYKPVLIYQKVPVTKIREWWSDVITAKAEEQDKSLHAWQQSEKIFIELVKRFSIPGQRIADPFAGSGTTARAAISEGRHFWGCDNDPLCATEERDVVLEEV